MSKSSFDDKSKPIIDPLSIYEKMPLNERTILVSFSIHAKRKILRSYEHEIVAHVGTSNGPIPIYRVFSQKKSILFFMSPISAAVAGTLLQEIHAITGVNNFVYFGSCGVLDIEKTKGKIIVPTHSYRDEGFSFHYADGSGYIEMKNAAVLEEYLSKEAIPYIAGKNYCTDAIYMETAEIIAKRKAEGCLSVDMESSGLQAVSDYLSVNLYIFFFGGDILGDVWEKGNLGGEKEKREQGNLCLIAIRFAFELEENKYGKEPIHG